MKNPEKTISVRISLVKYRELKRVAEGRSIRYLLNLIIADWLASKPKDTGAWAASRVLNEPEQRVEFVRAK
jgi:hypothetical protein